MPREKKITGQYHWWTLVQIEDKVTDLKWSVQPDSSWNLDLQIEKDVFFENTLKKLLGITKNKCEFKTKNHLLDNLKLEKQKKVDKK